MGPRTAAARDHHSAARAKIRGDVPPGRAAAAPGATRAPVGARGELPTARTHREGSGTKARRAGQGTGGVHGRRHRGADGGDHRRDPDQGSRDRDPLASIVAREGDSIKMQAYLTWLLDRIARLRRDRRLAQYARYRASVKGWQRTRRYNSSVAHQEAGRRWRYTHYADPDPGR